MYLDVYANVPFAYTNTPGSATNDTIFMDSDGKLYLGGGAARSENPSAGGVLRGTWNVGTPSGSASGMSGCPSGATPNTPAGIAAAGGLTNRTFVTATPLGCSPTTTITRAMIDAAPWGEMSLALTQACYLTFDATVTGTVDVATFRIYISGTNSLTWNTNQLTGTAWTNATANGSNRIFDKPPRAGTVEIW
jgi:hypothetical protein